MVEAVRLLVTLSTTAIGFQIGKAWPSWFDTSRTSDITVIWGAVVGAGVGYVVGGVLGRGIAHGLDDAPGLFRKTPAIQLFAGGFGLLVGVLVAAVISVPMILLLPPLVAWPVGGLLVLVLGAFGARVFAAQGESLVLLGGGRGFASAAMSPTDGERFLIDSSAAIDGRVVELVRSGIVRDAVWVPEFVVDELQAIADSGDKARRRRGRRGLDVLEAVRSSGTVGFAVVEDTVAEHDEVDAKLVTLAERNGATLVTTDHNLARAAGLRGIRVLNPHALGESLRPRLNTGDPVVVKIEKRGTEEDQGVGYLEDGTMVVVAGGASLVGKTVEAEVSNLLRTAVGRMIFARIAG